MLFYILLPIFGAFCLWLGYRILEKAGLDGMWTFVLLVPVVNMIMIWVFAFCHWPHIKPSDERDL